MRLRLITLAAALSGAVACTEAAYPFLESSVVISDRLSNQHVNGFAQDADGHIWMATFRGLNQYDAHEFHQYFCTDDTLGLPDNQVNAVMVQRGGRLWAATVNGAAYRQDDGHFHRVDVPGVNRNILYLMENREGTALLSNGHSLFRYDEAEDTLRMAIRELNAFGAPALAIDENNRLWVNGGSAVSVYDASDFHLIGSVELPFFCFHLADVGNGEIWLSGMGGLGILDSRTLQWKEIPQAVRSNKGLIQGDIDIIYAIDSRSILLHVIGKGMYYYYRTRESVVFQGEDGFPFSLPEAEIRTVFRDRDHNLWFGTTDQGYHVSYHYSRQFNSNPRLTEAFSRRTVVSVDPDCCGNLWISTLRDGLFCYKLDSKALQQVDIEAFVPDKSVGFVRCTRVFCDSGGDLWILLSDKYRVLRCRFEGGRLRLLDQVRFVIPSAITEDDRGRIWMGGWSDELLCYDKAARSAASVNIALTTHWTFVNDLLMDEPGRLLVASFGQNVLEVNTCTMEVRAREIPEEELRTFVRRSVLIPSKLFKDSAGNLWTGTTANGLLRQHGSDREVIADTPCLDICSIEEDRQGNVWVSTLDGLGKYDRSVHRMVSYFAEDGIGGNQFSSRASCLLPDGTLVFGGTHGLTWFNPIDVPAQRTVNVVFEDLTIHNRLVSPSPGGPMDRMLSLDPEVVIRHSQNGFGISFAALDYSEFEKIRYAYRLDGIDKDWVNIGTRHDAYFANLSPGRYTLRVRIGNGSHTVTGTEAVLHIHVLPPWWASWQAWCLWVILALALAGVLYFLYRRIMRAHRETAAKAEEARREKALNKIQMNYFSNVAHEFRTPLTMIAGPAQQLSDSPSIQGGDRQLVDIIRRNAIWMLSLVNQLLDFNRIGNSKLQMKAAKMDIVEPLRDTVKLFGFNAGSKGVELTATGLEEPFTLWVDADKVQKIVMNLLSNALKYTPAGGKITLSFDVVSRAEAAARFPLTEADTDGQWAYISVSDTGPGIAEGELEKIFERFYQTPGATSGTGIGLYYARVLASLHHGYIRAFRREEGGSLFGVALPVSAASYSEDERTAAAPAELQLHSLAENVPSEEAAAGTSGKHIAIVDDDIDIANYLKMLLRETYKVSVYFDGTSALKGMEEDTPDLVISDVMMPGMSGYQLCEAIKGNLQLSHIPVVLVTAKVAVESQVQGLGKGADAYVTKPFQPAYLLALVKSLLENREKLHRQLGSATTTEEIAPEALSPRDAAFMKELYALMEKELANADLDIVRMCEMMKISRTKFYYKVKGLTGENPSVFFKRYKLNRAADLLREGTHNMSEIAWMTGFNTLSHFSTSFKKQFGVPPSEYGG